MIHIRLVGGPYDGSKMSFDHQDQPSEIRFVIQRSIRADEHANEFVVQDGHYIARYVCTGAEVDKHAGDSYLTFEPSPPAKYWMDENTQDVDP